jgi:hypothetical protein
MIGSSEHKQQFFRCSLENLTFRSKNVALWLKYSILKANCRFIDSKTSKSTDNVASWVACLSMACVYEKRQGLFIFMFVDFMFMDFMFMFTFIVSDGAADVVMSM